MDTGQLLLTVTVGFLFLALISAILGSWNWAQLDVGFAAVMALFLLSFIENRKKA